MNTTYRLAAGHISVATLITGNVISEFPKQSDMVAIRWVVNGVVTTTPEYPLIETSMGGETRGRGLFAAPLVLDLMTFGMVSYFITTFFAGDKRKKSAPVTYGGFDIDDTAFYMQCQIEQPEWSQLTRYASGYRYVVWQLSSGVKIT